MDVFELFASLTLDSSGYDKGLDDAEEKGNSFGSKLGSVLGGAANKIGSAMATATKITAAGIGAASTAIGALGMQAVSAYAEYEQMAGGVKKLFGNMGMSVEEYAQSQNRSIEEVSEEWQKLEDAQNAVLANAADAYKTAGMSTNEYMENATSFSAALISSLEGDTTAAAAQVDVAMRAISDNYNTFGGDMENIVNAYKGFAKQNYTMLDNLSLGYGGTKEGMEQLISDANEYAKSIGQASDLSIDSFSDIVTAIELIQEKSNIAGTTEREAATTIAGSLGMLKSSWANLVAGFADGNADVGALMSNVVSSATTAVKNIVPVAKTALTSIATGIKELAPVIVNQLPPLLDEILPAILDGGVAVVEALVGALPDMVNLLAQNLPSMLGTLIPVAIEMVVSLITAIVTNLPSLLTALYNEIPTIVSKIGETFSSNGQQLLEAGKQLLNMLVNGITQNAPSLMTKAVELITDFIISLTDPNLISGFVDTALLILMTLNQGLVDAIPVLIAAIPTIIENLLTAFAENMPQIFMAGIDAMVNLLEGVAEGGIELVAYIPELVLEILTALASFGTDMFKAGTEWFEKIQAGFKDKIESAKQWGKDLIDNFVAGLKEKWDELKETVSEMAQTIQDYIGFSEPDKGPLSNFHTYAPDMMELFAQGIKENTHLITDQIEDSFNFGSMISAAASTGSGASTNLTYTQNIYSPESLSPSEIARETKYANRNMVLALRGI